jgi:hypothetical protein
VTNPTCHKSDLGCGLTAVCAPCSNTEVCMSDGTCCTPEGCNGRTGVVPDGCGGVLNCPPPH